LAVVRELITLLGTEVDTSGFQQYEAGIARLKSLAINAAKFIGIAFSVDKIIEFADGLVTAGKEINKLSAQLKVIARPFDDMAAAQEKVFETAQRLGLSYRDVLATYKEFQNEMRETTVPANDIVAATENIYKTLQVSRISAEGMTEALDLFNRSFQRGSFRSVGIGRLQDISSKTFDVLADYFAKEQHQNETREDMMRRLAKAGKVTAEAVVAAFSKANKQLDEEWSKVPQKLDKAFVKIYNDLSEVTARIYKMTDASVFMGRVVWNVWSTLRNGLKWLVDAVGGLENAIRLLGITLALVFGPKLLQMLAFATASLLRFVYTSWAAVLPWLGMAAAVAAVAVAIEDLVGWMQGRRSLIGTWVGPFKDLKENFKNLDIFAGFRTLKDIFTLDFEAFKKDFKILRESTEAEVLLIVAAIGSIGIALFLLLPLIRGVRGAFKLLTPAVKETASAAKGEALPGTGGKTTGKPGVVPEVLPGTPGKPSVSVTPERNPWTGEPIKITPAEVGPGFMSRIGGFTKNLVKGGLASLGFTLFDIAADKLVNEPALGEGFIDRFRKGLSGGIAGFVAEMLNPKEIVTGVGSLLPPTEVLPEQQKPKWQSDIENYLNQPTTSVTPGAMGPPVAPTPVSTTVAPTFNQNIGGIRIETTLDAEQIAKVLGSRITAMTTDLFSSFTRDMQTTAPRVEAATQN
jgi:hypothetical protein